MEVLKSLKNPRVQSARKLHRRQVREEQQAFIVEGAHAVLDAHSAGLKVLDLFVTASTAALEEVRESGLAVTLVTEQVLRAVADTDNPSGVVAVVAMPAFELADISQEADLVLVLAQVRDPGNAGTLVRSARAAGAGAVIFSEGSVDPFSPKTVRASAGAVTGTPIARDVPLRDAIEVLRGKGFVILGAAAEATQSVYETDLRGKVALVVGNEAWGLPEAEELVDSFVSIPMPGGMESLNVSVAGSLMLFEAVRQRRESSS